MTIEKLATSDNKRHFNVISGLRGIAVIMVVWFHFWQQSWWTPELILFGKRISLMYIPAMGFMGVEIFLVIAAFGLFYPYVQQVFEGTSLSSLKRYAYRRVIKILPSYYIMLVLVVLSGLSPSRIQEMDWWYILRHLFVMTNLFNDTFYNAINPVTWFVCLQIQFYLVFPLLALVFRKKPILTYLLLQAVGIFFRLCIFYFQYSKLSFLFNQLPGYIDMYANGMLAAYLVCLLRNRGQNLEKMKIFFTLLAISCSLLFFALMRYMFMNTGLGALRDYQLWLRSYFGWVLLLLIVSSIFAYKGWRVVLSNPFTKFMGLISFNLYLWHQWLAVKIRIGDYIPHTFSDPHNDKRWQVIYTIVITSISLIVAIFFTFCLELPLVKKGLKRYFLDIPAFFVRFIKKYLSGKQRVKSATRKDI